MTQLVRPAKSGRLGFTTTASAARSDARPRNGGGGFLRIASGDRFLGMGHRVLAMDNQLPQSANLAHVAERPNFEFHVRTSRHSSKSRARSTACSISPAREPVDYSSCRFRHSRSARSARTGRWGSMAKQARFLLASTSEVYGDPLVHPQLRVVLGQRESGRGREAVDEAKRSRGPDDGLPALSTGSIPGFRRIFNTYGPRMRPHDVASCRLHRAGAARRAAHGLRRRVANAVVLLLWTISSRGSCGCSSTAIPSPRISVPAEFTVRQLAERVRP